MPLVYQQDINATTKLGVWHIAEAKDFFLQQVPLRAEITHPHKQLQHLAGRYLLKALYPDFPYELISIADTRKPYLLNEAYHFSISHCGDYAAAMVSSTQRVGVDVEMITQKVAKVKDKFLSIDEQQILAALVHPWSALPEPAMLTAAWSIKESLFKWYGEGLIDFKDHLRIDALQVNGDKGLAQCSLLKNNAIEIDAQFIFLDDHCLCWVANG